ncbi:hypothetical protein EV132_107121 [Rhizobium sullae]|uniref:Uncharacterized protein n=1 Tax=Rhizobium sullae TaxID=50338 RepID=A0A4R3Q7E0_RHISU|nr:hypothetical protein EV132_107121 [Rhizobium sullae]
MEGNGHMQRVARAQASVMMVGKTGCSGILEMRRIGQLEMRQSSPLGMLGLLR